VLTQGHVLTRQEERELMAIGSQANFKKGEIIFSVGSKAMELHYILNGWVNIFKNDNDGRQISVGLRYSSEFAGLGSFACGAERGCTGQALIDSEIIILSKDKFLQLIKKMPGFELKIICLLGARLRDTQNNMVYFISKQTDKRLALILLNIGRFLGKQEGGRQDIRIKLSQEQIGHIIGCSRQTVNTSLSEFKYRGFIEMDGRKILSVYPDKLRELIR
jgi:CRP-like cAMP-binding protein